MAKLYAIVSRDSAGAAALRQARLAEHLAYVETVLDCLAVAGPLRHGDGSFAGSLVIAKAENEAAARALVEADPYYKAGVWDRIDIFAYGAVAGDWAGGKNW
ncbi:MAG: YciI family protein [Alphaproteobacteria bacterium]|nr:MAG: YciI family protein [Alphaproteobacteria bacterium]